MENKQLSEMTKEELIAVIIVQASIAEKATNLLKGIYQQIGVVGEGLRQSKIAVDEMQAIKKPDIL